MSIGQGFKRTQKNLVLGEKTNLARVQRSQRQSPSFEDFYQHSLPNFHSSRRSDRQPGERALPNGSDREGAFFERRIDPHYKDEVEIIGDQDDPDAIQVDTQRKREDATFLPLFKLQSQTGVPFSRSTQTSPSLDISPRAPAFQRISGSPQEGDDDESRGSTHSSLRSYHYENDTRPRDPDGKILLPQFNYVVEEQEVDEDENDQIETDFGDIDVALDGMLPAGMGGIGENPGSHRRGEEKTTPVAQTLDNLRHSGQGLFARQYSGGVWDSSALAQQVHPSFDRHLPEDSAYLRHSSTDDERSAHSKEMKSKSVISDTDADEIEDEDTYQPLGPSDLVKDHFDLRRTESECIQEALRLSLMDQNGCDAATGFTDSMEEMPIDVPINTCSWDRQAEKYNKGVLKTPFWLDKSDFCGIRNISIQPYLMSGSYLPMRADLDVDHFQNNGYRLTMEQAVVGNESEPAEEEEEETEESQSATNSRSRAYDSQNGWEIQSCEEDLVPDNLLAYQHPNDDGTMSDAEIQELYSTLHAFSPLYKSKHDIGRWSSSQIFTQGPASLLQCILEDLCLARHMYRGNQDIPVRNDPDEDDKLVEALRREIGSLAAQSQLASSTSRPEPFDAGGVTLKQTSMDCSDCYEHMTSSDDFVTKS